MKIKLFDVILHPRLETTWVHFDIEAEDQNGKKYYEYSRGYGGYCPPYPAFSHYAGENYFTKKYPYGCMLDPFDVNQMVKRLKSYEWEVGIKSIKFSNQVFVCPKTYIIWQSIEKIEGTNYFEIKELPSKREDLICCREDNHKVWSVIRKSNIHTQTHNYSFNDTL